MSVFRSLNEDVCERGKGPEQADREEEERNEGESAEQTWLCSLRDTGRKRDTEKILVFMRWGDRIDSCVWRLESCRHRTNILGREIQKVAFENEEHHLAVCMWHSQLNSNCTSVCPACVCVHSYINPGHQTQVGFHD